MIWVSQQFLRFSYKPHIHVDTAKAHASVEV